MNADCTRALITTGVFNLATGTGTTTRVALINTTTGTQIGTSLTLTGAPTDFPLPSAEGTHALISTTVTDPITGYTTSTRVAVLQIA